MARVRLILIVTACAVVGGSLVLPGIGDFERDETLQLPSLTRPVRVLRDEFGVPYIFAENTPDLIRAQGFVTAQHRLFQLEAYRAILSGRLAEAIGERGLDSDVRMRVFGIRRNAVSHASRLSESSRDFLGWFVDGLNAYVEGYPDDHHLEFSLAPFEVRSWSIEDIVAIVHYIHHRQAVNYKMELIHQRLIDRLGAGRASELSPINVNPDRTHPASVAPIDCGDPHSLGLVSSDLVFVREDLGEIGFGSNNWVVAPARSRSGKAIVANDPHLDARILPGIWHPIGLFTPEMQAIGAALPGLPGILTGRTAHVAFGVTNSYCDVQDVYVERLDPENPEHYLDGSRSVPFESRDEVIRIRDKEANGGFKEHRLVVRSTRRGPVMTDHGLGPDGDTLLTVRTTAAEVWNPVIGIEGLLQATSAAEFERELAAIDLLLFNFVFADVEGHIGQRATGAVPRRASCRGAAPQLPPDDGSDDWTGFVPKQEMPGDRDPARGWLGTANHDVRPEGYPYYYSSFFAPSYRYRRISEVLTGAQDTTVDDHWRLIQDDHNLQSIRLREVFAEALAGTVDDDLAAILSTWDGVDEVDSPAPLVYQSIYERVAFATFRDELGDELAADMLSGSYFWQERFDALMLRAESPWFDDVETSGVVESRQDMIRRAAREARSRLEARFGDDPTEWRWGDAHTITFTSPLRRSGFGRDLLGGGVHPLSGSRDTLKRGRYVFGSGFAVLSHDSLRLVADLGDDEKIAAVVPGGVVGRQFHENQADQLETWLDGGIRYWWFSQAAIEAHAKHEQWLMP